MPGTAIVELRWHPLRVSPKTVWSFVELVDAAGQVGTGEATLGGHEDAMRDAFARYGRAFVGCAASAIDLAPQRAAAASLAEFAVLSAIDQALWDLVAQARGCSVAALLGAPLRDRVPAYANVNRGIASRTPEGFARQARRAVADGFPAVKIAPFDEVQLNGDDRCSVDARSIDAGVARIAAVRDAIGPDVRLMVDCHWRLNRAGAEIVLGATEPYRLHWLECPVPETAGMLATIRRLRELANARGVRLAGCEQMSMRAGFRPFLDAGAYDVMMPDAKYVGGLREMLDVAHAFERAGVAFSPHNPSGPVCHAASLQVCAVAPGLDRLELQYAETPLFDDLVGRVLPRPVDGAIDVPKTTGLGVRLDAEVVARLASTGSA